MANERARQLRLNATEAERRLWGVIRGLKAEGFHFRRQAPMGNYIADFVCHSANLVIECDGGQHAIGVGPQKDAERTKWLESQGYRVLRFWNNDVLANVEGVIEIVRLELGLE